MLEELRGEVSRMLEESSGEVSRMLVDNSPKSPAPVENFAAAGDQDTVGSPRSGFQR